MSKTIDNDKFANYCRIMYDDNSVERTRHGQKPYNNFAHYFETNTDWLYRKFSTKEK